MIRLSHIYKSYPLGDDYVQVLHDLNLHVRKNDFLSILGPSGSGKSTLMNIIGCLDMPDFGEYIWDGENIDGCSENELSVIRGQKIGFIFQQFNLLPYLTAYENVEMPLLYRRMRAKDRKKAVLETLEQVGLIYDSDNEWHTSVCVIGTKVAEGLFETWDAVGGTVTIGDRVYKVIGVLEEQGSSLVGSDDSKILIPYSTAARITGSSAVSTFYIKANDANSVNTAINITESYLLSVTRDEDAYSVNNQSDILDTMDDVTNTMSLLLAGIAAISLIVGGIGIMNIMLVSVSERTKEIGIRKAVGAKRRYIMMQFLCESCVLSVLGGIIGLAMSYLGIYIYNVAADASIVMNKSVGIAAIAFCAVIGILFGSYPAAKASRLQPIEALRAE